MTATTASDPSGVEYYFTCTAGGGNDSGWQDSTTYEDTGLDDLVQYTYTVKARDKSSNQNETAPSTAESATTEDGTAPAPNPATWSAVPSATSPTSISMTATTASDPSGVQYYFTCTAGGGNNSGWQDSPTYEDTGLNDLTEYTYTARARDKSSNQNETAESTAESATTPDGTPPAPDPMTWASVPHATGPSSISMTATTATDPSGVEYYFTETSGNSGGSNSNWQDSPTYEDTGLADLTTYEYTVRARDKSPRQNETASSTAESSMTGDGTAPLPDPMTWVTAPYATSPNSISMTATTASDPSGVEYYFTCTAGGGNDSGWQDGTTYADAGLDDLTLYTYTVRARDKSPGQNETAPSTAESATTPDGTPPAPDPATWQTKPHATGPTSISMTATTATDPSGVEYYFTETSGNPGATDSGWQDSPTYENSGLDDRTEYTYTVKVRDKSPRQNETVTSTAESATTEDGTPPLPDPMTWQTAPYAAGPTSVAMVATTASDPCGVQYYFEETSGNPGGSDSGWQYSTTYVDTGLDDRTQYTYTVKARDISVNYNETAASVAASATTEDGSPPTPDPMTWQTPPYATGISSIAMVATTASDPNGVQYYFAEISGNPGGSDSSWQDSPSYEDTGLDDRTLYTYTVKARDLSINHNETAVSVTRSATTEDGTPPAPDPMTWQTPPYATGPSSIGMVATTASDPNGVQYYFTCTAGGGADSGWQNSPSYEDTGLDDRTQYTYTVRARDLSINYNETAASVERSATTQDGTPPAPDPMTWQTAPYATGTSSIAMVATTASDPNGVQYYFTCTAGGGHDSGWQNGTTYEDTGLDDRTQYTYTVKARDKSSNHNETAPSVGRSATTEDGTAPTPDPMTWLAVPCATGTSSIAMVATTASDPNGVQYYFTETSGNLGGDDSSWQDSPSYEDTGLDDRTQYTYTVKARDLSINYNETTPSTPMSATTEDGTPPTPDPMTWETKPYATGTSSIAMVATTASDPNGVQYYFANLTDPAHDSGWQNGAIFADTGLDDRTQYTYTVKARDMSVNYNETAASVAASATTEDGTPPVPDPMTWQTKPYATGANSVGMVATTAFDPNGVQYYFANLTDPNHDSGWQNSTFYEDTGLDDRAEYTYTVKARDLSINYNETAVSVAASATTEDNTPPEPDPMAWQFKPYTTGPHSIAMVAVEAFDPNGVQYYFANLTDPTHDSGWQDSIFYEDTGLNDRTDYTYTVKARDLSFNYNETAPSEAAFATTEDGTPPVPDPMTWHTTPYATGPYSIAMIATTASDPNGVQYYFDNVTDPDPNHDSGWQVSSFYEDTGLAQVTEYTYRVKARDRSINYNETAWSILRSASTQDGTPPEPDPMTWETVPYATGTSSIAMVATTASDPNGVQYFFRNITSPTHNSGWQNSPFFADTGLDDRTQYTYTVRARDLSINYNETAPSVPMSAITDDGTPPEPDPMTWATPPYATEPNSIAMVATTAYDPNGVQYYFANLTDPNHDSGWQNSPFYEDTGLAELAEYTYTVKARDLSANYNETAWSVPMSATTQDGTAPFPDPMTWLIKPYAEWATWADMTATEAFDPCGVEYYFSELSGNPGGSDSGWQDSAEYTDSDLSPETQYTYTVKARDKSVNRNETEPSIAESVTTPPPRPPLANDVIASTHMDVPTTITLNVIDDGLPNPPGVLSYIITSLPQNGTLSDPYAGLIDTVGYVLVNDGNDVIYTPDSEYLGLDGFSFKADDGGVAPQGGESNEADVFISVVIPEYFTEYFYWNDNDLDNHIITFIPDGSANYYMACREEVATFPTNPSGGTILNASGGLGDDDSIQVLLEDGKEVSIYGYSYSSFWVGSNGCITFERADSSVDENFANHFSQRRISGLYDDLNPS